MKKAFLIIEIAAALLLCAFCVLLFSCDRAEEPIKLTAPLVVLDGDVATWEANPLADKFEISIDGTLSYIESSMTSRRLNDGQTFKIRAVGDSVHYITGDWSNAVVYHASKSTNFTVTWMSEGVVLELDENVLEGEIPTYDGIEPTKAEDSQYTYQFMGWSPIVSEVKNHITYMAQFKAIEKSYTVTFYDEDGTTVLNTVSVGYGGTAIYSGPVPTKPATDGYTYTFEKWVTQVNGATEDSLTAVTADRSVYASYWENIKMVSVQIQSSNLTYGTVSDSVLHQIPYGTVISVNGSSITIGGHVVNATPNIATAEHTYTFSGWVSDGVVGNNTVIIANFSCAVNAYTVTWKNGDSILEEDSNVPYGTMPSYDGALPQKTSNENIYTFSGWSPAVSAVKGDVTYVAQFTAEQNTKTVTFYDEDGVTVLGVVTVGYGETATYPNDTPTKNATASQSFAFGQWVTEQGGSVAATLTNLTEDISVYATYTATTRTYTISFCNWDGMVLEKKMVEYGVTPTYTGESPTKAGNVQYTYVFEGWSPAVLPVSYDATYVAQFGELINTYTITWKNGDEILEVDADVPYGTTPIYNGAIPQKSADDEKVYTFIGWSPAVSAVSGEAVYVAQFTSVENVKTVTFYDEDGVTILGVAVVGYGENATYPNALPTKAATASHTFTFDRWVSAKGGSVEATLTNITENISVYATYTATLRSYTVTFRDWNGTVLKEETVAYGSSATAPDGLDRDGYRFMSWDTQYNKIVGTTVVNAQYQLEFEVQFLDYDGSVLYEEYVLQGESLASLPSDPVRRNHIFIGWSVTSFENIQENVTVYAQYVRSYRVVFYDYDGTVLKTQEVQSGADAEAPVSPSREGYTFRGWNASFDDVTSDLSITATYEINRYTVTFQMPDGRILSTVSDVKHGFPVAAPEAPTNYFDWTQKKGYSFTGWSADIQQITESCVITAVYGKEIEGPIIVVRSVQVESGTKTIPVEVYVYSDGVIYGLSLDLQLDEALRNAGVIDVIEQPILGTEATLVNGGLGEYTANLLDDGTYELRWTDTDGIDFAKFTEPVAILTVEVDLYAAIADGAYWIRILESTYIINENFEKETPVIISSVISMGNGGSDQ